MDFHFTPEQEAFRAELRTFLDRQLPAGWKVENDREGMGPEGLEFSRRFARALGERGWLTMSWPEVYGGRGASHIEQLIYNEEMSWAGAPLGFGFGTQLVGPTLMVWGSEEQRARHLPPIAHADLLWCQGFSEPGAGSDLASVQTRAEKTAGGYRVTGHKVWTTLAHKSKWMILLARTDPTVGKYDGLSYFLCPMDVPGVTVQPLIKMTGEGGFNQVIFENAPMPADALLGREGEGWKIAMTTLTFERGAAEGSGGGNATSSGESTARVAALAKRVLRDGRPAAEDPVLRDRLVQLWIVEEALRLAGLRARIPGLNAERPFALRLMNKLVYSEYNQDLAEVACQILGPEVQLWLGDAAAVDRGEWPRAFMNSFGMTIGGGTSEIQRNIVGERVLGLPKSK